MKARIFVSVLLLSILTISQPLQAQILYMTPGQYVRGQVLGSFVRGIVAIGELAAKYREIDVEIVTARRMFWEASNEQERSSAARRFEEALAKRDLHYLGTFDLGRTDDTRIMIMRFGVELAGGFRIDGGISPYCYQPFKIWAGEVSNLYQQKVPLEKAIEQAMPKYQAYRIERDIVEFLFFNPKGVLRARSPDPQEYLAAWILGTKLSKTAEAANAEAGKIKARVGATRLTQIAAVLRSWSSVTSEIHGPWTNWGAGSALEPLVTGTASSIDIDLASHRTDFAEIRARMVDPAINFAPAVDSIQQLWEVSRSSRDRAALRRAIDERDSLVQRLDQKLSDNLHLKTADRRLTLSMTSLNFKFIDRALSILELDDMNRGEINPRGDLVARETNEYLAASFKLVPRSQAQQSVTNVTTVTSPPPARRGPPAPSGTTAPQQQPQSQQEPGRGTAARPDDSLRNILAGAPVVSPPSLASLPPPDTTGKEPLDRAMVFSQHPKSIYIEPGHLSQRIVYLAKDWQRALNVQERSNRILNLGRTADDTQNLIRGLSQDLANRRQRLATSRAPVGSPLRTEIEMQNTALQAVLSELEVRLPDMRRYIAAQ